VAPAGSRRAEDTIEIVPGKVHQPILGVARALFLTPREVGSSNAAADRIHPWGRESKGQQSAGSGKAMNNARDGLHPSRKGVGTRLERSEYTSDIGSEGEGDEVKEP